MAKYIIKCDLCKKTIGHTDDLGMSASGGMCKNCKMDQSIPVTNVGNVNKLLKIMGER